MQKMKEDRYLGAMLGAAIGDALGWPNEQNSRNVSFQANNRGQFVGWYRKAGGRYWLHEERINAGEYSDDTQLLIATLRSLLFPEHWSRYFSNVELPAWLVYERGGGGATKRAAESWKYGISPWDRKHTEKEIADYFNAGGNGAAMRIMPHIFTNEEDVEKIMRQVTLNSMFTHGHPRAILGATLYAFAVKTVLEFENTLGYGELVDILIENKIKWGKLPQINKLDEWLECATIYAKIDYYQVWNEVFEETVFLLTLIKNMLSKGILDIGNDTLEKLGCFDKRKNGAGNITAVASIYLFSKYASEPRNGIIEASQLKNADTDTLASMTGALIGALYGTEWIPLEWRILQDFSSFEIMISKLFENNRNFNPLEEKRIRIFSKELVYGLKENETIYVAPFGQISLKDKRQEKCLLNNIEISTYICSTEMKQTIYLKKFSKKVVKKEDINLKANEQVIKNNNITLNVDKLLKISNIFTKPLSSNILISIIVEIIEEMDKNNGVIDKKIITKIKNEWKESKLTKKQIEMLIKIISE